MLKILDRFIIVLVLFLLATATLPQISESIFSPCLPAIAETFSQNMAEVEHVFTTYLFGYAIGMLCWGSLSDYYGRIKTLRLGLMVYLLGTVLCSQAPNLAMLLFSRFFQGVGGSACAVLVITLCRDYFEEKKRAKMMGRLGMTISIGPMLGPLLGSSVLAYLPWHFVYVPLMLFALSILGLTGYVPHIDKSRAVPKLSHYIEVIKSPMIWRYAFLIGHACGVGFSFFSEAPFFFIQALELPAELFSVCFMVAGLSWYCGGIVSQRMLSSMPTERVMLRGVQFSLAWAAVFCVLVSSISSGGLLIVMSLLSVFSIMLGLGLVIGNAISLALEPYAKFSGVAASILGFIYYMVTASIAGMMAELHNGTIYTMPFYWLYIVGMCAVIVYSIQEEETEPKAEHGQLV